jgi:hypothetical protein
MLERLAAIGLVAVIGVAVAAIRAPGQQAGRIETIIVLPSQATAAEVLGRLRSRWNAQLVASLPRTRGQVWQITATSGRDPSLLVGESALEYVEALAGDTIALLPVTTVPISALPPDAARAVETLVRGTPAVAYRVTASRPPLLAMDLLEAFTRVLLHLLPRDRPLGLTGRRASSSLGTFEWVARGLDGDSNVTLVVTGEGITGRVRLKAATYSIWPIPGGRHLIRQDSASEFPADHPPGD